MSEMSSKGALRAASLSQDLGFNWIFLVELIVCGILTLFFLFYFNRLFASIVSWAIRTWTWHKWRVYFDVQALQISLLGGRIFFKGIRYHGNNETILVHSGFITWTYWLRNVRELELERDTDCPSKQTTRDGRSEKDGSAAEKGGSGIPREQLPCRLSIEIKGLEWFIYNRSPAYDTIVAALTGDQDPAVAPEDSGEAVFNGPIDGMKKRQFANQTNLAKLATNNRSEKGGEDEEESSHSSPSSETSSITPGATKDAFQTTIGDSYLLQTLPVHIECTKAAVVLGNENTKSIFITKAEQFSGDIDATACRAPDLYKQMYNFKLIEPVIQLKPNEDFKEDQTVAASREKDDEAEKKKKKKPKHQTSMWYRFKRKTWHVLQDRVPYFSSSVETFSSGTPGTGHQSFEQFGVESGHQWQGLSRYLNDEEADSKAKWSSFEYATVTTILESPEATISYYWDEPGKVPDPSMYSRSTAWKTEDINGCRPPTWGIDVVVKGATVNYGPWADRQRADLQKVFFPGICKDAKTAERLKPGDTRIATGLKVYIQLEEDTILRVPIREESKNWKWKAHADTMTAQLNDQKQRNDKGFRRHKSKTSNAGPEIRPFGWLDLKMSSNATINYTMDMVAGQTGFSNRLKMEIPALEVTTSVNHGLLWRSKDQQLSCDLSNPLGWNALHEWTFDFTSDGVELFIIREHIFLLTDLVDDWTTGPPPDYLTFVPFLYRLNLQFGNFKLYFNVNDSNIINNPSDMEDNTFLVVFGTELTADLLLPINRYRPHRNAVSFDVKAHTGGLDLHVPPWNTQATFLTSKEVAQLQGLAILGKYEYCDTTSPSNTDTLLMDVGAQTLDVQIYGFFVRYLMKVKDNYFGEDMHFRTLDEYQQTANAEDPAAAIALLKPPFKKTNDLDVIFSINVAQTAALLPTNLYSAAKHVRIDIASLTADLRFTNYYMDLNLSLSPMLFTLGKLAKLQTDSDTSSETQLYIDGIEIYGNRLFGLPPTEPTYLCNWDFAVGAVTGNTSAEFLTQLAFGIKAFAFSFDDDENALPEVIPLVEHDVTFLRATIEKVHVWVHVEDSAFLASTGKIDVKFNDWSQALYSKKLSLSLPDLVVSCVNSDSAQSHRYREDHPVETHAYFTTAIDLTMLARNAEFEKDRQLQQEHIRHEDSRTHRTPFFLLKVNQDYGPVPPEAQDPPAMRVPPVPLPLPHGYADRKIIEPSLESSTNSSRRSLRRKSSFLSMASSSRSSQKSVIRSQSRLPVPARHDSQQLPSSRSQSRQNGTGSRLGHLRDHSVTSTGRQSSFYSVMEHDDRRALQSSSVAFSSPFLPPYLPLENVSPSKENVPDFEADELDVEEEDTLTSYDDPHFDDNVECISFIIQLKQGVRGYCNPDALKAVAGLLEAMQPTSPNDILDGLQMDSMSEIFDSNKQKLTSGKKTDVCLTIPSVRFRFTNGTDTGSQYLDSTRPEDQYDLTILGVNLFARSGLAAAQRISIEEPAYSSAIHLRVKAAQLSALERFPGMDNSQAAVNGRIEEVVFWFAQSDITGMAGSLKLEKVGVEMSSADLEFMASLLHRTLRMAEEQGQTFEALAHQQQARIQIFALLLSARGENTGDPRFLTKPSYVLRSSQGHLRTKDSWKAITRMRHVYNFLDPDEQLALKMHIADKQLNCPGNVREQVQAAFEKWRSWDLQDLRNSVLMTRIFGPSGVKQAKDSRPKPAKLTLVVNNTNFVLDPGPKQNEIALTQLSVSVVANVTSPQATFEPGDPASIPCTTVQIYCQDTSINLNWELCELAENILKLYNKSQDDVPPTPVSQLPLTPLPPKEKAKKEEHMHVVIATDTASINIDTINLHMISLSQGLKASVVLVDGQPGGKGIATGMLTAEAATTRIQSHQQEISLYQIRRPTLNVSCEIEETKLVINNTWKIAGLSEEITFVVQQDPIALLDIVDRVLGDEVIQLRGMAKAFPQKTPTSTPIDPKPPKSKLPVRNKINVALFLDKYYISTPLLHSLRYDISGEIARASFSARQDSEFVFDFDIKENQHDMQVQSSGKPRKLSVLQLPPTNGRIVAQLGEEENKMGIFVSVEPIFLDAAAIQSLLSALNRPEISGVIDELKKGMENIKERVDEIFHSDDVSLGVPAKAPSIVEPPKPFIYDAHLSLAGLEVFTDAPNGHAGHGKARLTFNLGHVQIEASNRLNSTGAPLDFPELQLNLRKIVFDLTATTEDVGHETCGNFAVAAYFTAGSKLTDNGDLVRSYHLTSNYLEINLFAETASTIVNVVAHLQNKIKELDLTKDVQYFNRLRTPKIHVSDSEESPKPESTAESTATTLFDSMFSLDFSNLQVSWIVVSPQLEDYGGKENLVLSLQRLNLSTRKKNSARLTMDNLMLQMVPPNYLKKVRSHNSALLPQIIFNVGFVSMPTTTRLAFQAAGDALDLRLTSQFVVPGSHIRDSIEGAVEKVRTASAGWMVSPSVSEKPSDTTKKMFFGKKRMESLLVDANFKGAFVHLHLQGMKASDAASTMPHERRTRVPQFGRYGQLTQAEEASSSTTMNSPGLGIKVEYIDNGTEDPSMNAEIRVDKSSNTLYPQVVPLVMEITNNIQTAMAERDKNDKSDSASVAFQQLRRVSSATKEAAKDAEESILQADPATVLGRTKLNLGIRICAQDFTLSCHPIARVAAKAQFDDIYVTMNTVRSVDHGHFFALSASMENMKASVQHVYSRESTGEFRVKSVTLSLMNSKHLKGVSGMSAILRISPMTMAVNGKQMQDFLLFRDIWIPKDVRKTAAPTAPPEEKTKEAQSQAYLVQRYQEVAATAAFPWNATICIDNLDVELELGQAIGKIRFLINDFWISTKKNSDWEQNLCLGFDNVEINSAGRLSGFASLEQFKIRTSIRWPDREMAINQTPLVEGAVSLQQFTMKVSFDYIMFLVADIKAFNFLLYNVRDGHNAKGDRLVSMLDGDSVQVFCTTTTAAQALALYQAFERLVQEKRNNYQTSLREVERFMQRKVSSASAERVVQALMTKKPEQESKSPITLNTNLIVTLKSVVFGVYPTSFFDATVLKVEAREAEFRFAVSVDEGRVHSKLGTTLGTLAIGLAVVKVNQSSKLQQEITVKEIVDTAMQGRGGNILRVPKVEAMMETWQVAGSKHIDYTFHSSFSGKVEVGWNYSRISFIRTMYTTHSHALSQRLGKPLAPSNITISTPGDGGGDDGADGGGDGRGGGKGKGKITAEVNVPKSRYQYTPVEPPVIEAPQLRDMGEATPPLEWIGLHRDRLPNLVHQIVIVTLLEVASEVEDAYAKILGNS